MTVYAYLRVSTQQQDEQNQRLCIDKKAEQLNLTIDKYIIDKKSGATDPSERNLGKLLKSSNVTIFSPLLCIAYTVYFVSPFNIRYGIIWST